MSDAQRAFSELPFRKKVVWLVLRDVPTYHERRVVKKVSGRRAGMRLVLRPRHSRDLSL